ncbi:MAG TPA: MYXO-CTERM sorting domain-containing protein [Polyangia bacterium]|jgi:hypothetical protein|nr:MYXO-CTERM sorting domain-containing protein [Polyangia bacterium]
MGTPSAWAQSGYLQPGDVAVTCVDTSLKDGRNHIQVTSLVPLPAPTDGLYEINYTDMVADGDGYFPDFNGNQDVISMDAWLAGEAKTIAVDGLFAPDEQVFLFQGALEESPDTRSPRLLWGFQMSAAGGWAATVMDHVSELPRSLAGANVAVKSNGHLSFAYAGPRTGTRAELQAAIADFHNWTADADCPAELTIQEAGGTGGSTGNAGDAATDAEHPGAGDGGSDGPGSESGTAGAGGSGGAGTGTGDGAGGAMGTGGVVGMGGVTGTGGVVGTDGGDDTAATGGARGAGGAGGVVMADAGIGGRSAEGGSSGIGGAPGAGGADGGIDAYDVGAADVDADLTRDASDASPARRMPVDPSGCGCSVNEARSAAWIGVVWFGLSLSLLARRRRRPATCLSRDRSRRAAGRVG